MTKASVIYHVPYALQFSNPTGGGVRPVKMLRAFEEQYDVAVVAGDAAQRREAIGQVMHDIRAGRRFEFCYSESSTMPTALTESHHLPTHPLLDFSFFHQLRGHHVPVGLFYRDIHWRFPMYKAGTTLPKRLGAKLFYNVDLAAYGRTLDHLFLPSTEMAAYVPLPRQVPVSALPPGHEGGAPDPEPTPAPVRLFYVGGTKQNYRMHEFMAGVHAVPPVQFTLCTRPDEWANSRADYAEWLDDSITVVHENGPGTAKYFAAANIGVVATEPQEYWNFAAPLKVYEYLGHGLPMIASEGSLAGRFVAENGVGWTVPYRREAFAELLRELVAHPQLVSRARDKVLAVRDDHSWAARVREVARVLGEVDVRARRHD
ncbi:glycosyltransferase [Propionibacteriaceae bacterium G1746]|uniref:glycosyltransferase n=1 Tax=Aestuariimicrobium sp. G57 TaxID=3418485 RepID=UPI003C139FDE